MYSNFKIIINIILIYIVFSQLFLKKRETFHEDSGFFITNWLHTDNAKTWVTISLIISSLFIIGGILLALNSDGDPTMMHNSVLAFNVGALYTMFLSVYLSNSITDNPQETRKAYSFLTMFALIIPLVFILTGYLLSTLLNKVSDGQIFERISYLIGGWLNSPYTGS